MGDVIYDEKNPYPSQADYVRKVGKNKACKIYNKY